MLYSLTTASMPPCAITQLHQQQPAPNNTTINWAQLSAARLWLGGAVSPGRPLIPWELRTRT